MAPRRPEQYHDIRERKKKQIFDAALRLFASEGYHASSISKIAREARISKGLIYNYYTSKEALLSEIISSFTTAIMDIMNPNHDDEITSEEMEDFFDLIIELLKSENELWKLFFQIFIQKDIHNLIYTENFTTKTDEYLQLIYKYFYERFPNPNIEITHFTSSMIGFSIQLVYFPNLLNETTIYDFKKLMKTLFIKPKITDYKK